MQPRAKLMIAQCGSTIIFTLIYKNLVAVFSSCYSVTTKFNAVIGTNTLTRNIMLIYTNICNTLDPTALHDEILQSRYCFVWWHNSKPQLCTTPFSRASTMYAQCFSIKAGRNTILSFQRISNQTDSARVRESPSEYQPMPSGTKQRILLSVGFSDTSHWDSFTWQIDWNRLQRISF